MTIDADTPRPTGAMPSLGEHTWLALGLMTIWTLLAVLTLTPGAVVITAHPMDTAHTAALVLRMAAGEVPHIDFHTPIGVAAIAPIAALVNAGADVGMAVLLAQAAMAALLIPALWWVGTGRLGGGWLALALGAVALIVMMGMIGSGSDATVSMSLHYNRWPWAVACVLLPMILLPGARRTPRVEGLILGAGFAVLALTKATFFVGLAPAAVMALVLRGEMRALTWALITGAAVIALVTAVTAPSIWAGYIRDLLDVAQSPNRRGPSNSGFLEVMRDPAQITAFAVPLTAAALLWRDGQRRTAAVVLTLMPGLALIVWQNWGHDPFWLPILAACFAALAVSARTKGPLLTTAVVAVVLSAPSFANVALSPWRMAHILTSEQTAPFMTGIARHDDIRVTATGMGLEIYQTPAPHRHNMHFDAFWGGTLPYCEFKTGWQSHVGTLATEVAQAGFAGQRALVADTVQSIWLFAEFAPVPGNAPWNYGSLPGIDAADIVIVPFCPTRNISRARVLDALEASGRPVTEVFRGQHSVVLQIGG